MREGYAIQVWRQPLGETSGKRWDTIVEGCEDQAYLNATWDYLKSCGHKIRMVYVVHSMTEIKYG